MRLLILLSALFASLTGIMAGQPALARGEQTAVVASASSIGVEQAQVARFVPIGCFADDQAHMPAPKPSSGTFERPQADERRQE